MPKLCLEFLDPRIHGHNKPEESNEEKQKRQKEAEKAERDKRMLPSPRSQRVTGKSF